MPFKLPYEVELRNVAVEAASWSPTCELTRLREGLGVPLSVSSDGR